MGRLRDEITRDLAGKGVQAQVHVRTDTFNAFKRRFALCPRPRHRRCQNRKGGGVGADQRAGRAALGGGGVIMNSQQRAYMCMESESRGKIATFQYPQ